MQRKYTHMAAQWKEAVFIGLLIVPKQASTQELKDLTETVYYLRAFGAARSHKLRYALRSLPAMLTNDVFVPWLMPGCSKSRRDVIKGTNIWSWETQTSTAHNVSICHRMFTIVFFSLFDIRTNKWLFFYSIIAYLLHQRLACFTALPSSVEPQHHTLWLFTYN